MNGRAWTDEEVSQLKKLYYDNCNYNYISKVLNRTTTAISAKVSSLGYKIVKSNNPDFKAIYQDYNWCYERFINRGMTHQEMALEAHASVRVIQKWCVEKYGLHDETFKKYFKLNDMQRQIIISGTLGDGHIDKRKDQPMYIESHADDEKEYLFWKYDILKNMCKKSPAYYSSKTITHFKGKPYTCKPFYRFNSKIVDDLKEIRSMTRMEKISNLTELGLCTYLLDDGFRSNSNWEICVAMLGLEDKNYFIKCCLEKFNLNCWIIKDDRYIKFDSNSSREIDRLILKNIPNDLDIIHKKILDKKLCEQNNYLYVVFKDTKLGLSSYQKQHIEFSESDYEYCKKYMNDSGITEITEEYLLKVVNNNE